MLVRSLALCIVSLFCVGCFAAPINSPEVLFEKPYPYPPVIEAVLPEPGAVLSDPLDSIGVKILPHSLLEPGDELEHISTVELTLDNQPVLADEPTHFTVDLSAALYDEQWQQIARGPLWDVVSWKVTLSPGLHMASVRVWSTSGKKEYTYSWAFQITE